MLIENTEALNKTRLPQNPLTVWSLNILSEYQLLKRAQYLCYFHRHWSS